VHSQFLEQRDKLGLRAVVINDEPRIDRVTLARKLNVDRVDMTAQTGARLEKLNIVPIAQPASGSQPGNAAANHRDLHLFRLASDETISKPLTKTLKSFMIINVTTAVGKTLNTE